MPWPTPSRDRVNRGHPNRSRERSPAHPRGKPGFLTHEDKVPRETDSPVEGDGFEPSVPREKDGEKAKESISHKRQVRKGRLYPPVVPLLRRQRCSPSASRPGVQPWQLHADAGDAADGGAVAAEARARA